MAELNEIVPTGASASESTLARGAFAGFAVSVAVLSAAFYRPLLELVVLAANSPLNSHILLIPFISLYLIWLRKNELATLLRTRSPILAAVPLALGIGLMLTAWTGHRYGWVHSGEDFLFLMMLSYVLLIVACGLCFFGGKLMWSVAFPVAMLLFMAPMPKALENGLESFFQHTSADAAAFLFGLAATPMVRDGLVFHLPGQSIQVAPECSGIRSSLVLFITSLLAGYLFLRTPWKKAVLTIFVIPLGILRNGFRIFTIGMLCVHVNKNMIDSPLHHRGGPVFFALSLVPFFLLLTLLRRSEPRSSATSDSPPPPIRAADMRASTARSGSRVGLGLGIPIVELRGRSTVEK